MHPLHDYIAGQVANKLRDRRILVWYDLRVGAPRTAALKVLGAA